MMNPRTDDLNGATPRAQPGLLTESRGQVTRRPSRYLAHEGRQVSIVLTDGSRLDDCELVSAGRGRTRTLWIYTGGQDAFIPHQDVLDLTPAPPPGAGRRPRGTDR
jgi:hypothetical protein